MSRLVDYFVIVGFDHEKERNGLSSGIILQRFPETNWEDTPFHDGIEWFCQPQGWALSTERSEPKFFVSVLTDVDASRHYCACLSFNETVAITPTKPADEDEEVLEPSRTVANITHHSIMYAPKCLVIVSRQEYVDTFRNCLGIIYTVWVENLGIPLETLVGNLLGCVLVPDPGGPQVRFSIGAGDRQALQPPAAPSLPTTGASVYMLLRLLGIHNAVTLWCALMSEHKILLVSLAAARLSNACRALAALMFPFRYAHVYIPLLPAGLAEVLATPTPFLIGIHSDMKEEVSELLDVIVADLDAGSLHLPPGVVVPQPDPKTLAALQGSLALVMQPELRSADFAFAPSPPASSAPHMLDKEIRAVFMRTLAHLLQGYRHYLTIIRIHPRPVLTFHKAGWVGARGLSQCEFTRRLLDSMYYSGLVQERGGPWRPTDIWDHVHQNLPEQMRLESMNPNLRLQHIQELAMHIHLNENPSPQTYQQRILRPPDGASQRIHQPPLPMLNSAKVKDVIEEATKNTKHNTKLSTLRPPPPRIVPAGAPPTGALELEQLALTNSARRLEVLRSCIAAIFECRYADARKSLPAVVRALRAHSARAALIAALSGQLPANKHLLHHQQFDLLVRLMNCALQSATALDEHNIAASMLPLATAYCRKLCTGVIQYAYMCIQEHPIWSNQQFWEAAFYQDVQKEIKSLYLPSPTHHQRAPSPRYDDEYMSLLKAQEPSALEIAAEQMRLWPTLTPEKQAEFISREESTLYSQAIHYANRMVYLLLPLETAGRRDARHDDDTHSHSHTNSVAESDSADAESGFDEADPGEAGNNVIKMVSRFVDKVCTEGYVTADHVRLLHQMIPGAVHMHLETVEAVARESRRLPPPQKARLIPPVLIPGETLTTAPPLRAYLVSDGRELGPLPAEGALYLTNYRIVFRGRPNDQFAPEQMVVRSFPISALTKEKTIRSQYVPHLEQSLQEGLQLRSATFQLIKVAFDEEVSSEQVEAFRKSLSKNQLFALAQPQFADPKPNASKHQTLRGLAKQTLLKTARKAGLKPKQSKRQRYVLPSPDTRSMTSPPLMASMSADTLSLEELELSCADAKMNTGISMSTSPLALRTLERLADRGYARDWARMGLATSPYRLYHNVTYSHHNTYPAIMPVPESIGDESIRRISRCYRNSRFPVATWRHPITHATLSRSAAAHHKGVIGMLKASSHQNQNMQSSGTETTSSIEQERYLSAIVSLTPGGRGSLRDSSLSLDSLLLYDEPHHKGFTFRGVLGRSSGGKGGVSATSVRQIARWGSLKHRQHELEVFQQRDSSQDFDSTGETKTRAMLYILTEKGFSCSVPGCESVCVEYPDTRANKHAFKKLTRACVPSATEGPADPGFYRLIEESGWLWQVKQLFQLSGAVIDLLDVQGSSVMLSLEDGWDVTAQISSLAQICLDPYYRTLEGFRILIEKEWLAFGHKFQQRSNLAPAPQQGVTPTFLMFLDCVHQLQKQFPLSFEFNDFYVRFLAFHSFSCRFRTFLCDCEAQRAELGLTASDDKRDRFGVETAGGSEEELCGIRASCGQSIFDYIEKNHSKSPIFYNFYYTPDLDNPILRPTSSICSLDIWGYYTHEQLSNGTPYDLELWTTEKEEKESRITITYGYDNIARCIPDAFTGLAERLRQLELEMGHLPHKWKVRWDQLELPNTPDLQRSGSVCTAAVRRLTLTAHKRGTAEVLLAGRVGSLACATPAAASGGQQGTHVPSASTPHRWVNTAPAAPSPCDHCQDLLWGPIKAGKRCTECRANVHDRCADVCALPCTRLEPTPRAQPPPQYCSGTLQSSSQQYYEQFSSNVAENRTHEGHLYKRGALLKGWKQRWFVLDSIKHQLRYYDAMEDSNCKGSIDLAEVIAVSQAPPAPVPPKKYDDRSFFDVRTNRRTYNFCASDVSAAQEWIEKLQGCLQ